MVGGKVYASNGVLVAQIGTSASAPSSIYCGLNFEAERKLDWIRNQSALLSLRLARIREQRKRADSEQLRVLAQRIGDGIARMQGGAERLLYQLDENDGASVDVTGTAHRGTYIEICHVSFTLTREVTGGRFLLSKAQGRIVQEAIAGQQRGS